MEKKKSNLLMMGKRIGVVLLLFIFFQSLGIGFCHAQSTEEPRLTVEFKKTPFVEVLNYIKQHTYYDFLYNNEEMKKIPALTRDFKNVSVSTVLKECLKGTGYTFRISHNVIVIKKEIRMNDDFQEVMLRGKVLDDKNVSLPGATLMVKGSKLGVSTDEQGKFILSLPRVDTIRLIVSFVGMESQEVVVTNFQKEIVVKMKPDTKEMEEVVITGYGNIRKSSFTGNSVSVSREQLLKVSKTNVITALQVFDPSFRIKENNQWGSDPNALPEMQIRGQSSIGVKDLDRGSVSKSVLDNNPNLPIFMMNGFEVSVEKVYDLDPNRIQNITILKDAAATALYGARAANGIVVITTVTPKAGEVNITYSMVGTLSLPNLTGYNLMHSKEKLEAEKAANLYDFNDPREFRNYNNKLKMVARGVDTYWLSKPLNTVFNHKHSLYLEGGSDAMRYGFDMTYNNENGVMKKSYRDRVGVGFLFEYLTKNVQVKNYISYGVMKSQETPYGEFSDYVDLLPYLEYKDVNGRYLKSLQDWDGTTDRFNPNPLYEANIGNYDKSQYNELTENLLLNWFIFPTLQLKGEFSVNQNLQKLGKFIHPESLYIGAETGDDVTLQGKLTKSDKTSNNWQGRITLAYNENMGLHNINVAACFEMRARDDFSGSATYRGFPSGEFTSVSFAKEVVDKPSSTDKKTRALGVLLSMNYSYNNIYLVDLSGKIDGSSEYGSDRRFAPFGSVGLGINIHNYSFLKESIFSELKIRGSYGQTGKMNFAPYAAVPSHNIDINRWYATGSAATLMSTRGNKKLKWEKTDKYEIGLNIGILNDLFYVDFSHYINITNGLVSDVTLPTSTGFDTYISNIGQTENKGFEINVRSNIINRKDLFVALFGNIAHNTNKIKKISDALKTYNEKVNQYYTDGNNDLSRVLTKYEEGQSISAKYGMKSLGIDPKSGQELYIYRDGTVSYEWKATEMTNIGDEEPWGTGAFGINLRYKKLSFFTAFSYKFGGDLYNETLIDRVENADFKKNVDKRALELRWENPGDIAMYKDIKDREETTTPTSRFMQRENVLEWTSMTLEYDFSGEKLKKLGINMLRFSLGASDLWRCSTVKTERGTSFPYANSVNFNLSLGF